MGKELVALLCGCIEGYGVIHAVIGREGHLLVATVDTRGRSVDEVLNALILTRGRSLGSSGRGLRVAAGLEDIVEANHVGLDIGIGILDAIAHAGLSGQIHNDIEVILGEEGIDGGFISDIGLDEGPGISLRPNRRAL
jgi:hypothetical protein